MGRCFWPGGLELDRVRLPFFFSLSSFFIDLFMAWRGSGEGGAVQFGLLCVIIFFLRSFMFTLLRQAMG